MNSRANKNYYTVKNTITPIQNLLTDTLSRIDETYHNQPHKILDKWSEIIGKKLAPMTEAKKLKSRILYVRVKSATLYSLLCHHEKEKILKKLQKEFSKEAIADIRFSIR